MPNLNKYTVVNHIDGCKTNNHINNLEWCSNEYNHKHAAINSLVTHGESHPNSKIDRNTVELLKIKMALGYSDIELSKEYNINRSLINSIRNNHIWAHVNIPEGIQPIKSNRSAQVGILVVQTNAKGDILRKFPSYKSAAEYFHIDPATVRNIANGVFKTTKTGLMFKKIDLTGKKLEVKL